MAVNLSALAGAGQQFFDNNGNPLSGGKLWSYQAGTTTPQTTYTTASGNVAHTNPIVLDSAGRVATGQIWLTAGSNYKFTLMTSVNVTLATWDNITGINGTGITSNASTVVYDPAGTGAVPTTVQTKLRESVSVLDFGANTTPGTTNMAAAFVAAKTYLDTLGGGDIIVPIGVYSIGTTALVFDTPNIRIIGQGTPNRSLMDTAGASVIKYSGTGTAITLGKQPVAPGDALFTWGICMHSIQIVVAPTTTVGVWANSVGYGEMSFVNIDGNSGAGRTGLKVTGPIIYKFKFVEVSGGNGAVTPYSDYLEKGLDLTQSTYSSTSAAAVAATAVSFERCYFHYCNTGAVFTAVGTSSARDCDFESNNTGVVFGVVVDMSFNDCHFENNQLYDVYYTAPPSGSLSNITFNHTMFNMYSRDKLFDGGGFGAGAGALFLRLNSCTFSTQAANPYLFGQFIGLQSKSRVEFCSPVFYGPGWPVATVNNSGSDLNIATWCKFTDMPTERITFTTGTVTANTTQALSPFPGATYIIAHDYGNIIGVIQNYIGTISAGDYAVNVYVNGVAVAAFAAGSTTTKPYMLAPLTHKIEAGDEISVSCFFNAAFSPATGSLNHTVLIAWGKDGTQSF